MIFYSRMSELISKTSHANLKLAKSLYNQKNLQLKLEEKASEVEEYASQMEELAEDRAKKLKDAERMAAIGQTAGMVGHDIRNPLQAITGDVYLAKTELASTANTEEKNNILESLTEIEKNIFYINKIVADLQDFARPLNPKWEQLEVDKLITDALLVVAVPDVIKTVVSADKNLPRLNTDSTMIQRIMVNLIQNAVQAMSKGGSLTISAYSQKRQIAIVVEDSGEGIPEEVRGKCVRSIYVSGVDEFNVVNVDFTDSTSLTVQIIPAAKLKVDYNDWTTGNLKPLKEWPLLITR